MKDDNLPPAKLQNERSAPSAGTATEYFLWLPDLWHECEPITLDVIAEHAACWGTTISEANKELSQYLDPEDLFKVTIEEIKPIPANVSDGSQAAPPEAKQK
jgi:hypothetical protein